MDQSQARIKPFRQVPTQIRACNLSMIFAFAFARNTSTHFVIRANNQVELKRERRVRLCVHRCTGSPVRYEQTVRLS
jgi:hypothetical protein